MLIVKALASTFFSIIRIYTRSTTVTHTIIHSYYESKCDNVCDLVVVSTAREKHSSRVRCRDGKTAIT